MKSNVIAAIAGGLVLGGAVFLPLGANAVNQEIKQVSVAQEKVAAPVEVASDELGVVSNNSVRVAGVDPEVSADPTFTPEPIVGNAPTFSTSDDDEDSNDDDSYGEDSDEGESDD